MIQASAAIGGGFFPNCHAIERNPPAVRSATRRLVSERTLLQKLTRGRTGRKRFRTEPRRIDLSYRSPDHWWEALYMVRALGYTPSAIR